jgi:hypothetical protein
VPDPGAGVLDVIEVQEKFVGVAIVVFLIKLPLFV